MLRSKTPKAVSLKIRKMISDKRPSKVNNRYIKELWRSVDELVLLVLLIWSLLSTIPKLLRTWFVSVATDSRFDKQAIQKYARLYDNAVFGSRFSVSSVLLAKRIQYLILVL